MKYLKNYPTKSLLSSTLAVLALSCLSTTIANAKARVALRTSELNDQIYVGAPNEYTFVKNNTDFLHVTPVNTHPNNKIRTKFSTNTGFFESECNNDSDIDLIVSKLNSWNDMGFNNIPGIFVYDEDHALFRGPGGPFPEDRRILPASRIESLRSAMNAAGFQNVQLLQLIGSNRDGGDTWYGFNNNVKNYLRNRFNGIGTETHLNDYQHDISSLDAQADIAAWCKSNGKVPLIFMGGGPIAMSDFNLYGKNSFNYLFGEMAAKGFNKKHATAIYFYQAARPSTSGEVIPESNLNTVTGATKWIIQQVH